MADSKLYTKDSIESPQKEVIMHEDEIPVGRAKDLRGQRFGKLTVLYRVKGTSTNARWKCLCDCGGLTETNGNNLTGGKTISCGCLGGKFIDITNQKFNRLTALYVDSTRPCTKTSHTHWICACECGNVVSVDSYALRKGLTQSCGCLQKEQTSNACAIDIFNQRFGHLIALYPVNKGKNEGTKWHCICDCGNECDILITSLRRGLTQSCGCLRSKGENQIREILLNNNLIFESQKTFPTCRFPDTNAYAKYDFYINNYYCLEYDGNIHFQEGIKGNGWNTQEAFEKRVMHDAYKNQWCKENNIPLIRIPYTKLDTLCIEDLLLETTKFRIV